jgi:hypothetical protein
VKAASLRADRVLVFSAAMRAAIAAYRVSSKKMYLVTAAEAPDSLQAAYAGGWSETDLF